ncbi:DUF6174 domain-containing protein [Anabaena azotica]|uniref:Uncharacterized protein n=1 Tax=Anabaena azotica FACHB-119 TaxID=947527 RepID=A0ABR8DDG7_9NOST|nr:DUF6174 domain-containing protein [Anabaena azotica]MBD2505038.1 hypothetical protein [Anabaena azotica FACHB-119]
MRLSTSISLGLLLFLSMATPTISQPALAKPQLVATNKLNVRQLTFNRNLWNKQNISSYRYTLSNSCFCITDARGPVIIEVRNGKTTSITSVATGNPVNPDFFQNYDTIPKLFNVIQDAIARQASSLTVSYDHQLGYPKQINIDYDAQIADEELFLTVENFQVIQ